MGGGIFLVVVFFIVFGVVIVVVVVNVGWFSSNSFPETGQWDTGGGFGIGWVTRVSWYTRGESQESGWCW